LGGDNFDQKIADYILDEFEIVEGISLRNDNQALQRITEAAEKAKIALSTLTETKIRLPFINLTNNVAKHIDIRLTRDHFEKLCAQSIKNCRIPVEQALKDARLTNEKIEQVVLVGGSTRIPAIQNLVNSITGKKLARIVNPDEVVAIGAAIQGGVLSGEVKDILLLDETPLSLLSLLFAGVLSFVIFKWYVWQLTITELCEPEYAGPSKFMWPTTLELDPNQPWPDTVEDPLSVTLMGSYKHSQNDLNGNYSDTGDLNSALGEGNGALVEYTGGNGALVEYTGGNGALVEYTGGNGALVE
jgi:hypothetical protein